MPDKPLTRTSRSARPVLALAVGALLAFMAGCTGSSLDTSTSGGTLTVGLVWPQTGPYNAIGADQKAGWDLYLTRSGGKLGGRTITTAAGDEGTSAATALTAAKKLLEGKHATVLVGTASGEANAAIADYATSKQTPFIGTGGRPTYKNPTWLWDTSWLSDELGKAIAPYIEQTVKGPVYAIGPNYQGGWDNLNGFTTAFTAPGVGGKLANPDGKTTWTPFPDTVNYLPYLNKIKDSGAKAVYTFYAGATAVAFLQQYQQAKLGIPLYGAGFLTEDKDTLDKEGAAAVGVTTVLNYAPGLDNPANRDFATLYQNTYHRPPTIYAVAGWDAALLLDQAIRAAGDNPTAASINTAIGALGSISSPRGDWSFGKQHSPIQRYYLRVVKTENNGQTQANELEQTLTMLTN